MSREMKSSFHRFRVASPSPTSSYSDPTPMPPDRPPSAGGAEKPQKLPTAKGSSIPACDRCRNFKKKCSRTFPVCSLCASAGTRCSFSTPASSTDAQTHHLRARLDWLTRHINEALPIGAPTIDTIETGVDLTELLRWIPNRAAISHGQSPALNDASTHDILTSGSQSMVSVSPPVINHGCLRATGDGQGQGIRSPPVFQPMVHPSHDTFGGALHTETDGPHANSQRLLPNAAARTFVDAYFRNVNRAYPFVDRNKVLHNLETLGDSPRRQHDADSTLLYLILAIGCTTLQRAGQIPDGTVSKFDVAYPEIIQECLRKEGIESIQILVLLALYSLFDPTGPSAWALVSIAARQAMLLGLTRRSSDTRSLSATEIELRHRLVWSIFVLDRMMATSRGLPATLRDENLDVPLPGLTVDEFASPERSQFASSLQTSRHVIALRQIEGRILENIHLLKHAKISALSHADRCSILQDIRADIENWYSNGCLVSPQESDNVPIYNSITWLSARYYYLLILLYYPSHFNSPNLVVSEAERLRFAQKHAQSSSVLFQQRQLSLNRVTLFRIFPVALVLVHGFVSCAADCASYPARDEVTVIINILEAFTDAWADAHRAAQILRQFLNIIGGIADYNTLHFSSGTFANGHITTPREAALEMVRPAITSLTALMQEVLGRVTCYASMGSVDDRSPCETGRGSLTSISGVRRNSDMQYGWGGLLDLEFL